MDSKVERLTLFSPCRQHLQEASLWGRAAGRGWCRDPSPGKGSLVTQLKDLFDCFLDFCDIREIDNSNLLQYWSHQPCSAFTPKWRCSDLIKCRYRKTLKQKVTEVMLNNVTTNTWVSFVGLYHEMTLIEKEKFWRQILTARTLMSCCDGLTIKE